MTDTAQQTVSFVVNGTPVSVRAGHPHLLAALREELGITSPKDGCSPSGQCGCCTVMIDGKAQVSCQYPVTRAEGRTVTTLEGVDETERKKYSDAFAACGGLQCGFCIPGIVMRAKSQVDKKGADLKREDMARHLGAHLCRCTGYVKVLDAIEAVAKGTPVDVSLPGGVGSRGLKYEAHDLALGDRGYVDDMRVDGMLRRSTSPSTPAPTSCASTPPRLRLPRASSPCSRAVTCPARTWWASSTRTGPSSSARESAPRTRATCSPSWWRAPASRPAPPRRW
jgi:aerobic-type carbon monoxide dehydrogenase small subunit (CoxS/CutS family)